jgi:hypothetical protein
VFAPAFFKDQANRMKKASYYQEALVCDLGAIRTRDPQLRRLLLYPTELRDLGSLFINGCKFRNYLGLKDQFFI